MQKPMFSEPGTKYTYSGGSIFILDEILKNATGMDNESFSWHYLFEPQGIKTPPWRWIGETGVIYAGCDQKS